MATQLAEPSAETVENDNTPLDYEAEARKMGWKPPEEFGGDPAKAMDAKTFYERGQEVMPILRAQNKALIKRLDSMERDMRRSAEFFSKAEERAYERAISDIKARMTQAVEEGDTKAADAAMDEMAKLAKPTQPKPEVNEDQRAEEFADWGKANRWYADNDLMRVYADAQAEKIARTKGGILDRADLDAVSDMVKAKFEDTYPEAFGSTPKPKRSSAVDGGGTAPPRRSGKTFADLPPEAQRMCDKWVGQGLIKSRDDYVKAYAWEDRK